MHALIIEDHSRVAIAIEDALREAGYDSFADATGVAAAVRAAKERWPDLIVADQRLVDGLGTDAVRALCAETAIPVVFVTASPGSVEERLPQALIVRKPFVPRTLHMAVRDAVERPLRC